MVSSSLSLSGIGYHWNHHLLDQYRSLSFHLGSPDCQILPLSLYLQSFLSAPDRVLVCSCLSGLFWHYSHQHLPVWPGERRSVVDGGCWHIVLAGRRPSCPVLGGDLSRSVRCNINIDCDLN